MLRRKVILLVLDGCRPDGLQQARTPNVNRVWMNGAYAWKAHTVTPSLQLPTYTSLFRGVSPKKHGVLNDTFNRTASKFPSIIDLAHAAGRHTAMFYSSGDLRELSAPDSVAFSYHRAQRTGEDTDRLLTKAAAEYLITEEPDFLFLHLAGIDMSGHEHGWMSRRYLEAVGHTDDTIGMLMQTLEEAYLIERFTVMLVGNHGGHGNEHGSNTPDDLLVPWIASGGGIRYNRDIRSDVSILDTAPTIAHLLELPTPEVWEGEPVFDALEDGTGRQAMAGG